MIAALALDNDGGASPILRLECADGLSLILLVELAPGIQDGNGGVESARDGHDQLFNRQIGDW